MLALLLAAWIAAAGVPVEALEAMLERDVVVVRVDGSEVPGQLVGVGEQTATVMKADGRVVSIPLEEIDQLRGLATPAPPAAAAPAPPTAPPPPAAAPPIPAETGPPPLLVGARYGHEEISLSGDMSFRSGRALRLYQFVDAGGRSVSQQEGWYLMGDATGFRRRGRSGLKIALDVVTYGCAAGILLVMLDKNQGNDRLAFPLAVAGLSCSFGRMAVTKSLQRRRGEEGLRRARERYGR